MSPKRYSTNDCLRGPGVVLIVVSQVLGDFFTFTERVFPVLHRPSFMRHVDDLYGRDTIGTDRFEPLAQFYFALSIGHWFNTQETLEERTRNQILALQTACRCFFTTLHTRRDGLTRLQTLTLHSYALILLRQRSEALRISAMANTKALEVGLHHDGKQFTGNPLETEMRRRVFWCVFMLRKNSCDPGNIVQVWLITMDMIRPVQLCP